MTIAHANRLQRIGVAGPDSLAAMISLCKAGFENVECAKQATRGGGHEAADLLLLVGRMSGRVRADVLARTCRLLRKGGIVAVQLERASDDAGVRATLRAAGMGIESTVFDLPGGCLVAHAVERGIAQEQGRRQAWSRRAAPPAAF